MEQIKRKHQLTWNERLLENLRYYLPTVLVAVAVLAIWEFMVIIFDIQQFLLPKPSVILSEYMSEVQLFLDPEESSLLF